MARLASESLKLTKENSSQIRSTRVCSQPTTKKSVSSQRAYA